jgi:hypothetical protein
MDIGIQHNVTYYQQILLLFGYLPLSVDTRFCALWPQTEEPNPFILVPRLIASVREDRRPPSSL